MNFWKELFEEKIFGIRERKIIYVNICKFFILMNMVWGWDIIYVYIECKKNLKIIIENIFFVFIEIWNCYFCRFLLKY